jgi:hypothetical protein
MEAPDQPAAAPAPATAQQELVHHLGQHPWWEKVLIAWERLFLVIWWVVHVLTATVLLLLFTIGFTAHHLTNEAYHVPNRQRTYRCLAPVLHKADQIAPKIPRYLTKAAVFFTLLRLLSLYSRWYSPHPSASPDITTIHTHPAIPVPAPTVQVVFSAEPTSDTLATDTAIAEICSIHLSLPITLSPRPFHQTFYSLLNIAEGKGPDSFSTVLRPSSSQAGHSSGLYEGHPYRQAAAIKTEAVCRRRRGWYGVASPRDSEEEQKCTALLYRAACVLEDEVARRIYDRVFARRIRGEGGYGVGAAGVPENIEALRELERLCDGWGLVVGSAECHR